MRTEVEQAPMLADILPAEAVVAEVLGTELDQGELFPQEADAIARAVPKRRGEFTAVRMLARAAFARAGLPAVAVVPGSGGEPLWPRGIVGSMTHCAGYRASVIARDDQIAALGIDAEPHSELPDGVLTMVSSESERDMLARAGQSAPGVCYDKILFSAKESVYKAWYPATGRWLGFEQAELTIDTGGTFWAKLLVPGPVLAGRPVTGYHGRWLVSDGLVITAIAVPAPSGVNPP